MNITIIVPVYHEEGNIRKLLHQISSHVKYSHEIIIVYEDPDDPTIPVIKKHFPLRNILLLKSTKKTGKGLTNAIKNGISHSQGKATVFVMADLSDDIRAIDTMYNLIAVDNYDIVCASRYMKLGRKIGGPYLKTLLSKIAGLSLYYVLKLPTHDATNSFKMYKSSLLKKLPIESTGGFEFSLELLLKAFRKKCRITEIPTVWKDREEGSSGFKFFTWLPQYIKWYIRFFRFDVPFSANHAFLLIFFFVFLFKANELGSTLRTGISIPSTLDFSWFSDAIERFLHGYLLGRDAVFTYGPLFQVLYSAPSILFGVPSYVSVSLSSLTTLLIMIPLVFAITILCVKNKKEQVIFSLLFFIWTGLLFYSSYGPVFMDVLKFLFPLVYVAVVLRVLLRSKTSVRMLVVVAAIPTIFGLFFYNLFIICFLYTFFVLFLIVKQGSFLDKRKGIYYSGLLLSLVVVFQLVSSLLLTMSGNYIFYNLDLLTNYRYIMNLPWNSAGAGALFLFPLSMCVLIYYMYRSRKFSTSTKYLAYSIAFVSVLQMNSFVIRSDYPHFITGLYPSIIGVFIILWLVIKENKAFLFLAGALYILVPYKPAFSFQVTQNIAEVVSVVTDSPTFLDIYPARLQRNTLYSLSDLTYFSKLIMANPSRVYVYPYDTFILNMNNQTFNAFPLQFYAYSNSLVEKEAVLKLKKNPPQYVILGTDPLNLSLDGIPSFTRNPLFFQWLLQNYSLEKEGKKYLVLRYVPGTDEPKVLGTQTGSCRIIKLQVDISEKLSNYEKVFETIFKPSIYLLGEAPVRIPYTGKSTEYIFVTGSNPAADIKLLFTDTQAMKGVQLEPSKEFHVTKLSPFLLTKTDLRFSKNENSLICFR